MVNVSSSFLKDPRRHLNLWNTEKIVPMARRMWKSIWTYQKLLITPAGIYMLTENDEFLLEGGASKTVAGRALLQFQQG